MNIRLNFIIKSVNKLERFVFSPITQFSFPHFENS